MAEDEIARSHQQLNGHELWQTPGDGDGQGGLACCGSWGPKESDLSEWLNWTALNQTTIYLRKTQKHPSTALLAVFSSSQRSLRLRGRHSCFCFSLVKEGSGQTFYCVCAFSVTQSCPAFCDPMYCSSLGSSVHGILQTRILEWVAISSSRGSFQPRDQTRIFQASYIGSWILYHWNYFLFSSPALFTLCK